MKIEHWHARSPEEGASAHSPGGTHFKWTDLLGVCAGISPAAPTARSPGSSGAKEPGFHCDTARGNATLFLHPVVGQNYDPRKYLTYKGDGRITATDERALRDLGTLNLNATHLRRGREAALDALRLRLDRIGWQTGTLAAELRAMELRPGSTAPEHAEFLRYHLERWLKRQTSAV